MASSARTYQDAVDALNSLQTPHAVLEARRRAGMRPDAASMREMRAYLSRIGYTPADIDGLNVVHVAGTKGKGSTCAYVDAILGQYGRRRGLFTSPHLVAVRERIRVDSAPLPEPLFARYFFDIWDRLGSSTAAPDDAPLGARPLYGRFLTLVSWHAFLQQGVDVAVYETGIGGEFDATNLVRRPAAAGISSIGVDHVAVLGRTVDQIAWHKAGIMKPGCPAFSVEQNPAAARVLRERARERGVALAVLPVDPRLDGVRLRPDAPFQRGNATLAVALSAAVLPRLGVAAPPPGSALPPKFVYGLEQAVLRGRCEVKVDDAVTWFVDGAHTADSLAVSSQWFARETAGRPGPRVLIFNQQSRAEAVDFLASVQAAITRSHDEPCFDHAVFCTNVTHAQMGRRRDLFNGQVDPEELEKMTAQRRLAQRWSELDPGARVVVLPTIDEGLGHARRLGQGLGPGGRVLAYVTGSLHLVGGALSILEQADAL